MDTAYNFMFILQNLLARNYVDIRSRLNLLLIHQVWFKMFFLRLIFREARATVVLSFQCRAELFWQKLRCLLFRKINKGVAQIEVTIWVFFIWLWIQW